MKRLLIGIAFLLVGLPVLAISVLIIAKVELDLAPYRTTINRWASMAADRQVTLDGDLRLGFGTQPSLTISQLSVSDGLDDSLSLAKADQLFVKTNLGVLFGAHLEVLEFDLAGGELNLRVDPMGRSNWVFGENGDDSDEFELDEAYLPQRARIDIRDFHVRYEDRQQDASWTLDLAAARAGLKDADDPLELLVEGVWDQLPLKVSGNVRPSPDAGGPDAPQLLSFTAQVLGIEARAEGSITGMGSRAQHVDVNADASTNELSHLRDVFGEVIPAAQGASLHFEIKDDSEVLQVAGVDARIDRAKIVGDLSVNRAGERPALLGKFQVSDLDTRLWMPSDAAAKEDSAARPVRPLEPLAHLPLPPPVDAEVSVMVRNIVWPEGVKSSLTIDLNVDERNFGVELSELDGFKAPFKGSLRKQLRGEGVPTYAFKLHDPDFSLAELASVLGMAGQIQGQLLVDVDLRSRGASEDEIRKALDGHVRLLMGAGKANVAALDRLVGGLTANVGQVLAEKSELAVVNCLAANIAFGGGRAKVDLGLIDTAYSTVLVDGAVDLTNRTLDLQVMPRQKALALSVAPKVLIKGSVDAPEFIIEEGSLVLSLGQFIANVAYPPALLVGVFDEAARQNPCVAMLTGEDSPTAAR